MFEMTLQSGEVKICEEKHYLLLPSDRIDPGDLKAYSGR
jgi:hypothetical protein